ncbi:MAG: sugar phosphate isomerase/epimerase [Firmicutes bacterium]|nr:sugar phosphate isomerase/epimerase [Bacillota bacterium]MDD4693584.1 sugar phosphate isomerase/epimerase [Bacillota bacterium]
MKVGCSSWSFHRTIGKKEISFKEWIRLCGEHFRLDGVELLSSHFESEEPEYLLDIKNLCTELGLTISCVSAENNFTTADEEELSKEIEKVNAWIDIAALLGAPVVRIFAGASSQLKSDEIWANVVRAIRECSEYAAESGIMLGLENHGGFMDDQIVRIINDVDMENFKVTMDLGNFGRDANIIYKAMENVVSHTIFVHAKCLDFTDDLLEKNLDYGRIMDILDNAGYNGFLSIEFEGKGDEKEEVTKAVAMLRHLTSVHHKKQVEKLVK